MERENTGDHTSGEQVSRLVWKPLAPLLKDTSTVLVAPDGILAFLPWAHCPTRTSLALVCSKAGRSRLSARGDR